MTLIQDIETPKPFTKNIPGETITAKYGSIDMFYTFQDDYIEWKHYVNDILSAICHNYDIMFSRTKNKIARNTIKKTKKIKEDKSQLKVIEILLKTKTKILRRLKITIPNGRKILKTDPAFPHSTPIINPFTVLDHQPGNIVTNLSEEDAPNIQNSADLRKANNNGKRVTNIRISEKYIEK